jgi:malate synthase
LLTTNVLSPWVRSPARELESQGLQLLGPVPEGCSSILTPAALYFVANLDRVFRFRRSRLIQAWDEPRGSAGPIDWPAAAIPDDLQHRRFALTGPSDRKLVIKALNSGADYYLADFGDSSSATWEATIQGQANLRDAIDESLEYTDPASGTHYQLNDQVATLIVRPRGWRMDEQHLLVDGRPVSASLFDFGLFFYHNAQRLVFRGKRPCFYLPEMENQLAARLWSEVFQRAERDRNLVPGSIHASVSLPK